MDAPVACVAILNYNGRALLDEALRSIAAQRFDSYDVVVLDNGSSDDSVRWVREHWPQVRVVALERNIGVTAALNAIVEAAGDTQFVALCNNDVELDPGWLGHLVETLRTHPHAAAAAGKLLRHSDRTTVDRVGDELHWSSACYGRGAGEPDDGRFDHPQEVFSVGGAAALYRMEALRRVGPFDERFFAYLEDVDWGFRARLAGYGARYEPRAVGLHHGGATLGEINPFSLYHLRRNQVWLVVKNYPARSLLCYGASVALFNAVQLAGSLRSPHAALVLRAYRDALAGLPRMLVRRRAIQRGRRVGHRALRQVILPPDRP
ncbi:MAG: glycosyltransferase family 2 protein [Actinobacteria bacterium]|nr:glycosyltransferase family 2 protein [Actinomycetota bacterium]